MEVSRYKYSEYLQHAYLSNIIPKSKLIELDGFLMDQLESIKAIKVEISTKPICSANMIPAG